MSNTPFDPSKFTVPKAKPLPVILLFDVSGGSMSETKIHNLNDAVRDYIGYIQRHTENGETKSMWQSSHSVLK